MKKLFFPSLVGVMTQHGLSVHQFKPTRSKQEDAVLNAMAKKP